MITHPTFNPLSDLPRGTVVLEASAGTGKTWTIAALATRFLAEGRVDIHQLMVITFSRQATHELRNRVRARLLRSVEVLASHLEPTQKPLVVRADADLIDDWLLSCSFSEQQLRYQRLTAALFNFDTATIATTHEFSQRMLNSLGILVDHSPDDVLVEDLTSLTREVAADFYLRAYADRPADFDWLTALQLAEQVVRHADAEIANDESPRSRFAIAVRQEIERRKRLLRIYTYHDQQQRLAQAVQSDHVAERLAARYPVVLVDEFQDTDPVQWQILHTAFHRRSTLVLIGDPKQAIYGFRGADVHTYLRARHTAEQVWTLDVNRRSDGRIVDGLAQLLTGAELGDAEIVVHPVSASHRDPRITLDAPLRLRVVPVDDEHSPTAAALDQSIINDLVQQVQQLLRERPMITVADQAYPLSPRDFAVLAQSNYRADQVVEALRRARIPVVRIGAANVYATPAADDWLELLQALAQPRSAQIRRVTLTVFFGWTVSDLSEATEAQLADASNRVRRYQRLLHEHGIPALVEAINADGLAERVLRSVGGARLITDVRHIGQDLHAAQRSRQLGIAGLIEWLGERRTNANADNSSGRRLDTDADAVQVMTLHAAKGLEFPIVLLPDLWRAPPGSDDGPRPRPSDGVRILDLKPRKSNGPSAQELADSLRRCYVALTRASRVCIVWSAWNDRASPRSPLHRLLQRPAKESEPPAVARRESALLYQSTTTHELPVTEMRGFSMAQVSASVAPVAPVADIDTADQQLVDASTDRGSARTPAALQVRGFDRVLDLAWRRTSYSGLTAKAHEGYHSAATPISDSEPLGKVSDEPDPSSDDSTAAPPVDPGLELISPMSGLVAGAAFGTLVHEILERVDTGAADLEAAVAEHARGQLERFPIDGVDASALATALVPVLTTPLGRITGDRTLADFSPTDRLAELDFEYPLGGGNTPGNSAVISDIAELLRQHLSADDPLVTYPDRLDDPLLADEALRGWLTGSIDAVLRADDPSGVTRHYVVDYKTNWLGGAPTEPLTVASYVPAALAQAMMASHYPLQALLYSVALHRFLRMRLPGYHPQQHLGGVLYLFVRGMAGPQTPVVDGNPCGVFAWQPPTAMIIELSELLHRGAPATTQTAAPNPSELS